MVILGQNDVFCGHNLVIFQWDFFLIESMDFWTAWFLVMWVNLVRR